MFYASNLVTKFGVNCDLRIENPGSNPHMDTMFEAHF